MHHPGGEVVENVFPLIGSDKEDGVAQACPRRDQGDGQGFGRDAERQKPLALGQGEVLVDEADQPVFVDADGTAMTMVDPLDGWIGLWQRINAKAGLGLELAALGQLVVHLRNGSMLKQKDLQAAVDEVNAIRQAYGGLDLRMVRQEVKTEQISIQLENAGLIKP